MKQTQWNELEKTFHEPARLALVTALCSREEGLGFKELREECGLTDGNLSRHLKVLEEAGVVHLHKQGKGRGSHTQVWMTEQGRETFQQYLATLEALLHGALESLEERKAPEDGLSSFVMG